MAITISTVDCTEEIKQKLHQREKNLNSSGVEFIVAEEKNKDYTLFEIEFKNGSYIYNFNESLADIIAEIVLDNLEEKIVKKIVKTKYNDYPTEDKKDIINNALKYLSESQSGKKIIRKKKIVKELLSYLNRHKKINIEGFVRFRLRDYMKNLNLAIEQAADDFIIEREYNEFIDLLRYFVELQEVKIPLVNVLHNDDGSYTILDANKNVLKSNFVEGYIEELIDEDITYEDILISALINISPGKVIIHFSEPEIRETLKNIFPDLVEVCFGCDLCEGEHDFEKDKKK